MIRRRLTIVAVAATTVVAGGLVASAGMAGGHKTECNKTYSNATLHGGVVIKSGDNCTLKDVRITGGLTITGGRFTVQNSSIHGQWRITGGTAKGKGNGAALCGNSVDGGIRLMNTTHGNFLWGETHRHCKGGRINGGVRFVNNTHLGILELDGDRINGGIVNTGNQGTWNEIGGVKDHGRALCANNSFVHGGSTAIDDSDSGPNSYKGKDKGCPR